MKLKRFAAILALSLFTAGCPQLVPIIQGAMNAAQWIGSIIEVADHSQRSWFAANPDLEKQIQMEAALLRARKALAAMNAVAVAAKSADDGNLVKAKADLIEAYKALEQLFLSLSVPLQAGAKVAEPPRITESDRVEAALAP